MLAGNDANILEREGRAGLKEEQLCDDKQYKTIQNADEKRVARDV